MKVGMFVDLGFPDDQRAQRAAGSLVRNGVDVTVFTLEQRGLPKAENVNGVQVQRVLSPAIFDIKRPSYLRSLARRLRVEGFEVLHCYDWWMLGLGTQIKRLRPESILVYDSKELFHGWPLNLATDISWLMKLKSVLVRKYLIRRERANGRHVDHLITVNESLADRLSGYFKLRTRPIVIRNVPVFESCGAPGQMVRERFGISLDCKVIVFIGASLHARTRNIEVVIDELGDVAGVALVLISGEGSTKKEIEAYVQRRGHKNIFFHPWVAPENITACLSACDVGLVPTWNRKDLSYWLALDNKLFHYIMAELPVLATAQPEYRKLVEHYGVGVCVNADKPGAYLEGFEKIMGSYAALKENVRRAKLLLNWEQEEAVLLEFYRKLEDEVGRRKRAGGRG